jgi:hypothetical protein
MPRIQIPRGCLGKREIRARARAFITASHYRSLRDSRSRRCEREDFSPEAYIRDERRQIHALAISLVDLLTSRRVQANNAEFRNPSKSAGIRSLDLESARASSNNVESRGRSAGCANATIYLRPAIGGSFERARRCTGGSPVDRRLQDPRYRVHFVACPKGKRQELPSRSPPVPHPPSSSPCNLFLEVTRAEIKALRSFLPPPSPLQPSSLIAGRGYRARGSRVISIRAELSAPLIRLFYAIASTIVNRPSTRRGVPFTYPSTKINTTLTNTDIRVPRSEGSSCDVHYGHYAPLCSATMSMHYPRGASAQIRPGN